MALFVSVLLVNLLLQGTLTSPTTRLTRTQTDVRNIWKGEAPPREGTSLIEQDLSHRALYVDAN